MQEIYNILKDQIGKKLTINDELDNYIKIKDVCYNDDVIEIITEKTSKYEKEFREKTLYIMEPYDYQQDANYLLLDYCLSATDILSDNSKTNLIEFEKNYHLTMKSLYKNYKNIHFNKHLTLRFT